MYFLLYKSKGGEIIKKIERIGSSRDTERRNREVMIIIILIYVSPICLGACLRSEMDDFANSFTTEINTSITGSYSLEENDSSSRFKMVWYSSLFLVLAVAVIVFSSDNLSQYRSVN